MLYTSKQRGTSIDGGNLNAYMLRIEMQSECYFLARLAVFCCCKPFLPHTHERKDCFPGWWEGNYQQMTDLRTSLHAISVYLRSMCFPTANCRALIKAAIK